MAKKRIMLIGEGVTLAHIVRPLMLAKALDQNTYDIVFVCDGRFHAMAAAEGLPLQTVSTMPSAEFLRRLSTGEPLYRYEDLKQCVAQDLKLLEEFKPDLVIGDFRISLGISARSKNVPYANLTNVYWSPYSTLIMPLPELPVIKLVYPSIGKMLFRTFSPLFLTFHLQGFNALCREYGIPPASNIRQMYTDATWTLYLDLPSLVPVLSLPPNHRYIGPVCNMLKVPQPAWWGNWPKEKPVVYLSLGSSGDITLTRMMKNVLGQMDVSVILTSAGRVNTDGWPSNFYVTDFLNGLDAAKAASLFITNGGSGATYQALWGGLPILGLPSNMDQFFLTERLQRLGAGILLRPSQASTKNIRRAITTLLNDQRYTTIAAGLGTHVRGYDTNEHFRRFIADALAGVVPPSS